VLPLRVLKGSPDVRLVQNWVDDVDGYRVFGWHARPRVTGDGGVGFSMDAMVCGEVTWEGDGPEMVEATVTAKSSGREGYVQIAILRDPALPPRQVNFSVRNDAPIPQLGEGKEWVDATGALNQAKQDSRAHLVTTYAGNGNPDDSDVSTNHPHRIWAWNMENRIDFYGRVGRITAA